MEVTIKVPKELADEARAKGVSVELYVQEILTRRAQSIVGKDGTQSVREAIDEIRELRKGNKLDGLQIKDLIHQEHKY